MPNYFQLINKSTDEAAILSDVDTKLWEHFEGAEPENNTCWYQGWYDVIGLAIAMGKDFEWCRENFTEYTAIIDYLDARYTTNAFYSPK